MSRIENYLPWFTGYIMQFALYFGYFIIGVRMHVDERIQNNFRNRPAKREMLNARKMAKYCQTTNSCHKILDEEIINLSSLNCSA